MYNQCTTLHVFIVYYMSTVITKKDNDMRIYLTETETDDKLKMKQ